MKIVTTALLMLSLVIVVIFALPGPEAPPPPVHDDGPHPEELVVPPRLSPEAGPPETVETEPVSVWHGIVVDGLDRPIAGACVGWNEDDVAARAPGTVKTEADGQFRLEPNGPHHYVIVAVAPGTAMESVRVPRESTDEIRIRLTPGGAFRSVLLDESGEPVPGARLVPFIFRDGGPALRLPPCTSDPGGAISFPHLTEGRLQLMISAKGHAPAIYTGNDFILREGDSTRVDEIRLGPGHDAAGRVVGLDGLPIAGVEVRADYFFEDILVYTGTASLEMASEDESFYSPWTTTDADGRFLLPDLPFAEWRLQFKKDGYIDQRRKTPKDGAPLNITLVRAGTIELRVRRPDGSPATKFEMWYWSNRFNRGLTQKLESPDGGVLWQEMAPGTERFQAWTADGLLTPVLVVSLDEGEAIGPITMTLEPGSFLTGRVLDPDGSAVSAAPVVARLEGDPDAPRQAYAGMSRPDGSYRVGPVSPGVYRLLFTCIRCAGGISAPVRVGRGETIEADLHLARGGSLNLLVTVEGKPVEGAAIHLRPDGGIPLFGTWPRKTDSAGELNGYELPLGWSELEIDLPDGRTRHERVEVVDADYRLITLAY